MWRDSAYVIKLLLGDSDSYVYQGRASQMGLTWTLCYSFETGFTLLPTLAKNLLCSPGWPWTWVSLKVLPPKTHSSKEELNLHWAQRLKATESTPLPIPAVLGEGPHREPCCELQRARTISKTWKWIQTTTQITSQEGPELYRRMQPTHVFTLVSSRKPTWTVPRLLTHKNCEIINVHCSDH